DPDQEGGVAEPGQEIVLPLVMRDEIAHRFATRYDMPFRHFNFARAHLEHFEEKGAGMFHAALTAARAALRIAESSVRHVMPGTRVGARFRSRRRFAILRGLSFR